MEFPALPTHIPAVDAVDQPSRKAANLAHFLNLPRALQEEKSPHGRLLRLYIDAQEKEHESSLAEIKAGQKTSHWIWWEWPAYTPVRSTSRPEYDLPSCTAATAWLAHGLLGKRWMEITTAATQHLEHQQPPRRLFGSGTDAAKFHESVSLASICAPHAEQRELATRALTALGQPPHPAVVRLAQAERDAEQGEENQEKRSEL